MKIKTVSAEEFSETIQSGVTVVDFFATWCGPCQMMAPCLECLAEKMQNVTFVKVDIDECEQLAVTYGVNAVPNICMFVDGKLVDRSIGYKSESALEDFVKQHLN